MGLGEVEDGDRGEWKMAMGDRGRQGVSRQSVRSDRRSALHPDNRRREKEGYEIDIAEPESGMQSGEGQRSAAVLIFISFAVEA
jgi:hypothetical protein